MEGLACAWRVKGSSRLKALKGSSQAEPAKGEFARWRELKGSEGSRKVGAAKALSLRVYFLETKETQRPQRTETSKVCALKRCHGTKEKVDTRLRCCLSRLSRPCCLFHLCSLCCPYVSLNSL